jgi:WD40 repeat protein
VILLDQLEELFDQDRVSSADAARFVELAAELARSGVVWVVAAMRSDFYHRAAEIPALLALSEGAGQRHLPPPDFAEIGQMIRLPARAAGLRFEAAPDGRRLDDMLHEAAARDASALPLLSFALDELFKRRNAEGVLTIAAYEALGGLEGALARRAEEVFQSLSEAVRGCLPDVLRALVSIGRDEGEPATARRAPLEVVSAGAARSALIEAFVEARLLVADSDEGGATVRFAHEALLRRWPRLADWLQEDREFLRVSARIAEAERRWRAEGASPEFLLAEGKPLGEGADLLRRRRGDLEPGTVEYIERSIEAVEARRRRAAAEQKRRLQRTRLAAAAFATIAALAGGAGWYGLNERREADVQREVAVIRAAEATTAGEEAKRQAEAAVREQRRADSARRAAEVARLRAETQGRAGVQAQSLFLADAARRAIAGGDVETAMLLALEALPDPEQDPPRPYVPQAEAALYEAVANYRAEQVLQGFGAPVTALAWSPDGARLAAVSADGRLRVWLPGRSARPAIAAQAHRARATAVAFAPDGRRLATAGADGSLELWDVADGKSRALAAHGAAILDLCFSPDGRRLASAGWDGARLWDGREGVAVKQLPAPGDRLVHIAFSEDGRQLAARGWSGESWRWNAAGKKLDAPDGPPPQDDAGREAASPDGRRIAVAMANGDVVVRAARPAEAAQSFQAHHARISHIAISPRGDLLATAGWDGEAALWTFPDGRLRARLEGHRAKLHDIAFSPDGRLVATASRDRTARLWDARDGALAAVLQGHEDDVRDVEFSPDGSLLATASDDGRARLFDVESGRLLRELAGDPQGVRRVSFSRDGRRLVAAGLGGPLRAWSVEGAPLATLEGLSGAATQAAFDPTGEFVVGSDVKGRTLVWRVADGATVAELDAQEGGVWHIAFTPAGDRLLTASADGAVRIWSARTWRLLAIAAGHGAPIEQAVFTPDGGRIVTAATDGALRLVDSASGEDLARPAAHARALTDAAVSPDGRHVVASAMDGGVLIATIYPSTEALVRHARSLVARELSPLERRRFFLGGQR